MNHLVAATLLVLSLTACSAASPTAADPPGQAVSQAKDPDGVFQIVDGILAMKSDVEVAKVLYEDNKADTQIVPHIEDESYRHLQQLFSLAEQAKSQEDRTAAALAFVEASQGEVSTLWTVNRGYKRGYFYRYAQKVWTLYTGKSPTGA